MSGRATPGLKKPWKLGRSRLEASCAEVALGVHKCTSIPAGDTNSLPSSPFARLLSQIFLFSLDRPHFLT